MFECIAVGMGGFIGAVCRYLLSIIPLASKFSFPFITLFINFSGSILIGFVTEMAAGGNTPNPYLILFLKTGVCGGFTTFSTFALESTNLMTEGKTYLGTLYMVSSIALCLFGVLAGRSLAK